MIPTSLALEARVFYLLLLAGIGETTDVVRWADSWIIRLENPPDALLEASLNGKRVNDLIHSLGELADPQFSSQSVGLLCRTLHQHLIRKPGELRRVVHLLYLANVEGVLPDDFGQDVYMLDDSLDLAVQGIFGTVDDIYATTIDVLKTYGASLPQSSDDFI